MTVSPDTYIARMMEEIGWRCWTPRKVAGSEAGLLRYPVFTWSDEVLRLIDGVLLSSEPYRFTEAHVDALEKQVGRPVRLLDGEMMSWYGSRAIAGLRYLRELLTSGG